MADAFDYAALPSRVVFGKGALDRTPALATELGMTRVLVIATGSQARTAATLKQDLGAKGTALYAAAAMHTPVDVTEDAMNLVRVRDIDGLIALGGGSAIGLSKAIALRTDLPQIAIPTTYAGSEMTPVVGETLDGRKTVQRSMKVLPEAVIYDVELSLSLPVGTSVTSGFNAIAHAVEALYSKTGHPLLWAAAEECVRSLGHALPRIARQPDDEAARELALRGAWLGGWSLANGGSALHHRLCHVLGGAFGLPHAETHTVVLPHVLAYNAASVPRAIERLARALMVDNPGEDLFDLAQSLGAPSALKALGMPEAGIDQTVEALIADPPWNPRELEAKPLRALLRRAWSGARPR